jgi:5'-3' exonuclease
MLIDGKNNIYRSMFAAHADTSFKATGFDYYVVFIRFLTSYVNRYRPESVHVFWDAPLDSLWRKKLFPAYKVQRTDMFENRDLDVKAELKHQMLAAIQTLQNLKVRQYYQDNQEADDLIYAFVCANPDKRILIVSSDGDMKQIIYKFSNVKLLNPLARKLETPPDRDPVLIKALTGDTSDNIPGYYQIGKARVKPLIDDVAARKTFLQSDKALVSEHGQRRLVGSKLFTLNRVLIDLGLSPHLDDNIAHIKKKQEEPVEFNLQRVEAIAQKYKLRGLMANTSLMLSLKRLV